MIDEKLLIEADKSGFVRSVSARRRNLHLQAFNVWMQTNCTIQVRKELPDDYVENVVSELTKLKDIKDFSTAMQRKKLAVGAYLFSLISPIKSINFILENPYVGKINIKKV